MSAKKRQTVVCPHCAHEQQEPPAAYSTVCRSCGQHFRLQDVERMAGPATPRQEVRTVTCFQCATELDVPLSAQSTMCKRCSSHVDLKDYTITSTVSKNFKTKGRFVVEANGYLLNSETTAWDVILKGRVIGTLRAENILELHETAIIKGRFSAGHLIIPPTGHFNFPELTTIKVAEVRGELVVKKFVGERVIVRAGARFFGDIEAAHVVIESGAVVVGQLQVSSKPKPAAAEPKAPVGQAGQLVAAKR